MRHTVVLLLVAIMLTPTVALADDRPGVDLRKAAARAAALQSGMSVDEFQWAQQLDRARNNRATGKLMAVVGGGLAALGLVAGAASGAASLAVAGMIPGVLTGGFGVVVYRGANKRVKDLEANKPRKPALAAGLMVSW